ncbi:polysaccharide biosynthesis protein [Candidatus Pelagibacter communis]|uniref:polysaccharide biosynthesis protein n=1 Tax=Pelagibacter ubique TaxID=198252 RepID=UPI00094C14B0|nr:polysaccharide biosynthesis protein [Candidatus Pelagibacter ubique]
MFKNKIILITGGTGSFGSSMVKFLLKRKISFKEIRILSRDEKKQDDLRKELNSNKVKFFIGDVKDKESIKQAMFKTNYVFHAAAYKQVPSCEFYPMEAVKTNVLGTENVINSAIENKVSKVVCLSTDKAVYPINAMGISKALMEKVAVSKSISNIKIPTVCVTRYGNVMGSRGSVIPLFVKQILSKKPITVTDLNMTRFMMSMEKALELVLYALKYGKNGEILIRKTPAATIETIIKALKSIFNKKNYPTKLIGYRHGEKKDEFLMTDEELQKAKENKNFFSIQSDNRNLNYSLYFNKGKSVKEHIKSYSSNNVKLLNTKELIKELKLMKIIKNNL